MNAPISNYYDPQNASVLVQFAAAAYHSAPSASLGENFGLSRAETQRSAEGESVIYAKATDTLALVWQSDTDIIIAFRGTADLRNWITDLDWKKVPLQWCAGNVHQGFNVALESVAEPLDRALDPRDPRRIWITGHSLGGALAMLFALRLKLRRNREAAGVYTFGQPRIGNVPFSVACDAALKARIFRVVHADDLVPRIPWLLGSYCHAGHEVFYPGGEGQPCQMDRPLWERVSSELRSLYREITDGQLSLLADHHVSHYVGLLAVFPSTKAGLYRCSSLGGTPKLTGGTPVPPL